MLVAYVALGGAVGAVARYGMDEFVGKWLGHDFPYGTFAVNVLGSLLMGVLVALFARIEAGVSQEVRALLAVGVLGGFTTFSSFSLDVLSLYERGAVWLAGVYVLGSVLFALLGIAAGVWMVRVLW